MLNTFSSKVSGQPVKEKNFSFSAVLAVNNSSFADKKFSNIPYNGIAPAVTITGLYSTPNSESQITALYSKLTAQHNRNATASVKQSLLCMDYNYLKNFSHNADSKVQFKAGGVLLYTNTVRLFEDFINLNQSFETILCAGPSVKIVYKPNGKSGNFQISNKLMVPLVYFFVQPQFAANGKPSPSQFFKEGQFLFFRIVYSCKILYGEGNFFLVEILSA